MNIKISRTETALKFFEIGLALKLNKIPLETVNQNIPSGNIDNVLSAIEDLEVDNWDGSHITSGGNLKAALEMLDMTQAELARRLNIPPQKINDLVHDRLTMTIDWAKKIGKAVNLSYKNFL